MWFACSFSSSRVRIEHVNGALKEKFSSLKELRIRIKDASTIKHACDWIKTCIIIYNIILPIGGSSSRDIRHRSVYNNHFNLNDDQAAKRKRLELCEWVMQRL
jgi:hypothetical protein